MAPLVQATETRTVRALEPGELLWREGERPTVLYQVKLGWIKLTRCSSNGRDVITDLLFEGDFFDLPSLMDARAYDGNAQALSGVGAEVAVYEKGYLLESPQLLQQAEQQCFQRYRHQRQMLAALATERVEQRTLMALLMLAQRSGQCGPKEVRIPLPLTRQELAELIGTTTESAIRVLSDLRKRGWIRDAEAGVLLSRSDIFGDLSPAA